MAYTDPQKQKEARKKSADKNNEKTFSVRLPRGEGLWDAMQADMKKREIKSLNEYMLTIIRDALDIES